MPFDDSVIIYEIKTFVNRIIKNYDILLQVLFAKRCRAPKVLYFRGAAGGHIR